MSISDTARRLAGCIPILFPADKGDAQGPKLLFINSRKKSGTLVFPKGGIKRGERPKLAAIRETFEEAGVAGKTIGRISGRKNGEDSSDYESLSLDHEAELDAEILTHWDDVGPEKGGIQWFLLNVEMIFDEWPEMDRRTRTWVALKDAHRLDALSSGTRKLVKIVQKRLLCIKETD